MVRSDQQKTIVELFGINDLNDIDGIISAIKRIDIDTQDIDGRTMLMEAAIHGHHELMTLLLDKRADTNIRDRRNWTALLFAAQAYDLPSVTALVEAGANISDQNDWGNNAISLAVFNSKGRGEVIRYLISKGADLDAKNQSGISARDLANTISNYNIKQFLE